MEKLAVQGVIFLAESFLEKSSKSFQELSTRCFRAALMGKLAAFVKSPKGASGTGQEREQRESGSAKSCFTLFESLR